MGWRSGYCCDCNIVTVCRESLFTASICMQAGQRVQDQLQSSWSFNFFPMVVQIEGQNSKILMLSYFKNYISIGQSFDKTIYSTAIWLSLLLLYYLSVTLCTVVLIFITGLVKCFTQSSLGLPATCPYWWPAHPLCLWQSKSQKVTRWGSSRATEVRGKKEGFHIL